MTLAEYLSLNNISLAQFGKRLGERPQNVHRWANGSRLPRPAKMQAIVNATGGQVMPADFYADLSPVPTPDPTIMEFGGGAQGQALGGVA